ncbi:hypothetical protein AAVH_23182 [Aphelenchoides avenae]|nr:hypothetical protein AAVH_23182 [Aphelenchus avenae]
MFTSSLDSIQDVMFREYAEIFDELSLQYKDVMRVIAGKTKNPLALPATTRLNLEHSSLKSFTFFPSTMRY